MEFCRGPVQAAGVCVRQPFATADTRVGCSSRQPAGNFLYSDFLPPRWIPSVGVVRARPHSREHSRLPSQLDAPCCAPARVSFRPPPFPSCPGRVGALPSGGPSLLGRPPVHTAFQGWTGVLPLPAHQTTSPHYAVWSGTAAPSLSAGGSSAPLLPTPAARPFAKTVRPPSLSLPRLCVSPAATARTRRTPVFGVERRPQTPEFGAAPSPKTPEFGGEPLPQTPEFGNEQARQRAEDTRDELRRRDAVEASIAREREAVTPQRRTLATMSFGQDNLSRLQANTNGCQNKQAHPAERERRSWGCRGLGRRLLAGGLETSRPAVHSEASRSKRPVCGESVQAQKCGKCHRFLKAKSAKPPFCVCAFTSK
ncbi:UNVERIFIED_CONTAM: hypothetical protein HHA_270970 [Hammondia hammondi]|eukprot:XP_008882465.1 hypothetical protein HHA_270970 [Hammondia hammondi]